MALNSKPLRAVSQEDIDTYAREVIPYWQGKTMRERIFSHVPPEWQAMPNSSTSPNSRSASATHARLGLM